MAAPDPDPTSLGAVRTGASRLELSDGMPFASWITLGRRLSEVASASAWWLGDWLVFGERAYGSRYRRAVGATGLDYQTLRNYAWVARRFEPSRRWDGLSLQHHAEVAALPDAERDLWLGRAQRARWSRNELRRQLRLARRARGDLEVRVVRRLKVRLLDEERWTAAAAACGRELDEWIIATVDAAADAALVARLPGQPSAPSSSRRLAATAVHPGSQAR